MLDSSAPDIAVHAAISGLEPLLPLLRGPSGSHGSREIAENPDGSRSLLGWSHAPHVLTMIGVLDATHVVYPFDWVEWVKTPTAQELQGSSEKLRDASLADVRRLLTAMIRSERFNEGTLALSIEEGLVPALLERLIQCLKDGDK